MSDQDTAINTESLTLVEAVNDALAIEMGLDDDVILLGEDIGQNGGVFRATEGLYEEFGEERVVDTPLAESGIVGTSIGMAASGLKPVPEIQFMGFIYAAIDQLFTRGARIRARSRGFFNCQMVVRAPYGGGIRSPELHAESTEVLFVHHPGLKVVVPSTPRDAKGLLISAIRDPDPVLFLEPKKIYRSFREDIPAGDYETNLGEAAVRQEGSDLSVFCWGAMTRPVLSVADEIAPDVDVEVIDLRTLSPLDEEAVIASAKKTGRAVIVHEGHLTNGLGGEIASTIQEEAMFYLDAPIERITGFDTVYPLYELEDYYLPNELRVREGIESVLDAGP